MVIDMVYNKYLNHAIVRAKLCQFLEKKARDINRKVASECLYRIIPREHAIECKLNVEPTKEDRYGISTTSIEIYDNLIIDHRVSHPFGSKYIELTAKWYVWETEIVWW